MLQTTTAVLSLGLALVSIRMFYYLQSCPAAENNEEAVVRVTAISHRDISHPIEKRHFPSDDPSHPRHFPSAPLSIHATFHPYHFPSAPLSIRLVAISRRMESFTDGKWRGWEVVRMESGTDGKCRRWKMTYGKGRRMGSVAGWEMSRWEIAVTLLFRLQN